MSEKVKKYQVNHLYMVFLYVVFVGHHKTRLMDSIKHWMSFYPPEKFMIVTGQEETTGEIQALRIAREMVGDLKTPLYTVSIERIAKTIISEGIVQLINLIIPEKKNGYEVLLDVSGSLRIFSVMAYIVALLTQSKLVSVIPKYDTQNNEIGIEKYIEIPVLPQYILGDEKLKILRIIGPGVDSVESLVNQVSPESKVNEKKYRSERSRISYYLESLEDSGFIVRTREGKSVRINLTELGKIFSVNLNFGRKIK
ncbi:MAG: DUF6293 family protein [Candidatus Helarchaeota archaeon]